MRIPKRTWDFREKTWVYHPKLRQRVWVYLPGDVRSRHFRNFAHKILEGFEKIKEPFNVKMAEKAGDVSWGCAKKYLKIMREN